MELFQTEAVSLPTEMIEAMRASDVWGWLIRFADTLPYEVALFDSVHPVPTDRLAEIATPTLAIDGGLDGLARSGATAAAAKLGGQSTAGARFGPPAPLRLLRSICADSRPAIVLG